VRSGTRRQRLGKERYQVVVPADSESTQDVLRIHLVRILASTASACCLVRSQDPHEVDSKNILRAHPGFHSERVLSRE